jgi:hypothetical protein
MDVVYPDPLGAGLRERLRPKSGEPSSLDKRPTVHRFLLPFVAVGTLTAVPCEPVGERTMQRPADMLEMKTIWD